MLFSGFDERLPYHNLAHEFKVGDILFGAGDFLTEITGIMGENKDESEIILRQFEITNAVYNIWKEDGTADFNRYQTDAEIRQARKGFNEINFQRITGFRDFLSQHPRYNVVGLTKYIKTAQAAWKKTSKGGLEYQIMYLKKRVHFLIKGLNIKEAVHKRSQHSNSVISSELRWLYRYREHPLVRQNVYFWNAMRQVSHQEFFGNPGWKLYTPNPHGNWISSIY